MSSHDAAELPRTSLVRRYGAQIVSERGRLIVR